MSLTFSRRRTILSPTTSSLRIIQLSKFQSTHSLLGAINRSFGDNAGLDEARKAVVPELFREKYARTVCCLRARLRVKQTREVFLSSSNSLVCRSMKINDVTLFLPLECSKLCIVVGTRRSRNTLESTPHSSTNSWIGSPFSNFHL